MNLPGVNMQALSAQFDTIQKRVNEIEIDPQVLISRLSFSHIIELMGEKDPMKRTFYEVDLKTQKFHHTDAGQMNFYLNYYRDNEISKDDNPPVGIVLCTDKRSSTVKYATGSLSNNLFVSRYQVKLPTVEELEEFIRQDIRILDT